MAKLASDIEKPDGFVVIKKDEIQSFLDPLPVSRLWGVGKASQAVFERFGIKTIQQVRQQSPEFLVEQFGKFGLQLWELSQGIDQRKVVSERQTKSISNETTFADDVVNIDVLHAWLMQLTEQVAFRLREHQLKGKTIQIKVRYSDFTTYTRSATLDTLTRSTRLIWQTAKKLLDDCIAQNTQSVRLIGVGIAGLSGKNQTEPVQSDLFSENTSENDDKLDQLTDKINQRFGKRSIHHGRGGHLK